MTRHRSHDDSDQPPSIEASGEIETPHDGVEMITPPPMDAERLLRWHARKLPNKINEIVAAVNSSTAAPRDHEARIRNLELKEARLMPRIDAMETDVTTNTRTLEGVKKFMWTMLGMATAGSLLGGAIAKLLLK